MKQTAPVEMTGIGVSPGLVYGKAFLIDKRRPILSITKIVPSQVEAEIARFRLAVKTSRQQIAVLRRRVAEVLHESHARIYDSHLMMLDDATLHDATVSRIEKEHLSAESAFDRCVKQMIERFAALDDPYLRARGADLDDIYQRVMNNLQEQDHERPFEIDEPVIVIARDLTPSDTANMIGRPILAFVTDKGGPTSHAAIMAKALEIPAVVSVEVVTGNVNAGDVVVVDGSSGRVVARPDEATLRKAERAIRERKRISAERLRLRDLPAETRDGYRIELAANIEFAEEVPHVWDHGADGIGLYRTEFHYLNKESLPEEEELFEVYSRVVAQMAPKPVIFRTVDLGGDKLTAYLQTSEELNPFLGLRAIRLCLAHPEIFRIQLRAILRATVYGAAKIMFPLVTRIEEVRAARRIVAKVRKELRQENQPVARNIEIGIMVEIPSAALSTDILAREVDFFSIGTNDLIQYTLAVDRVNQRVAHLYDPLHPSILRLIDHVITAAHEAGIWVGVCGEMASDPMIASILVGMGVDELSMASVLIPETKALLRSITLTQARELAREVLKLSTSEEIRNAIARRRKQFLRVAI